MRWPGRGATLLYQQRKARTNVQGPRRASPCLWGWMLPSSMQWPRFPLSIAVGVGPGSGSPQSVMFLRVSTRTMTRARFQIGNQLPIWNFGGMDASMLLMPLMACILRPSRRQYRRPALPQLPPAQSGRRQSFVVRASAGSSSPHTAHAIDNVFRPAAPMPSKSSWA
jgi:hypothetical protein